MEREVQSILRAAAERGLPSMVIGGNAVILLGYIRTTADLDLSKPEVDWEDIRQIVRICGLDPEDESFRQIILRYGGDNALARIQGFVR